MTNKIYRSAMGVSVDMGALALQNQNVRAVGNMGVNARGDKLDSQNNIVESRSSQVQKQNNRTTANPSRMVPHSSSTHARRDSIARMDNQTQIESVDLSALDPASIAEDTFADLPEDNDVVIEKDSTETSQSDTLKGGLAAAIARSREVKQEKEKTLREKIQEQRSVKKI